MLSAAMEHQLSLGITSSTDPGVMSNLMAVYRDMDGRGVLQNRLNVTAIRLSDGGTDTLPLTEPHHSDFLRVDSIKLFADSGLSGATAALSTLACPFPSIVPEALYGFTMGGAIASGDADNRGSISPGKWADLALLSENPLAIDPENMTNIRVDMTLVVGNICYEP